MSGLRCEFRFLPRHSLNSRNRVLKFGDLPEHAVRRHHLLLSGLHDEVALACLQAVEEGVKIGHGCDLAAGAYLDNRTPAAILPGCATPSLS